MNIKTKQGREKIIGEIREIDRMRQGTISEQYYGTGENKQGPYYVLQGYDNGKHWSKRIPKDQIDQVRADIKAGECFKVLCQDYVDLTEQATIKQDGSKKKPLKQSKHATKRPKHS